MATLRNILNHLFLAILVGSTATLLPAVAQTRQIGPELPTFLNVEKSKGDTSSVRDQLTAIMLQEVGTLEVGKNNHGPGPKKYLAACGLGEGYAYCACFVKWVLLQCNIVTKGNAWSPTWAEGPEIFWKQGQFIEREDRPVRSPQPVDVFTLYYANLKRVGHVGLIYIWNDPRADDWVFTVEGNTNGEGSREGDGVHKRRRLKRSLYTIGNYID